MNIMETSHTEDTVKVVDGCFCKSKNVSEKEFHCAVPFTEKNIIVTFGNNIISYSNSPDLDPNYTTLKVVSHTITKGTSVNNHDGLPLVEHQQIISRCVEKPMEISTNDTGVKDSCSMETSSDESDNTSAKGFSSVETSLDDHSVLVVSMSVQWPPPALPTKKFLKMKHRSLKKQMLFCKSLEWPPPINNDSKLPKKLLPKSYSRIAAGRPCKLKTFSKVPKRATGKEGAGKGRTLPVKWLSYTSRGIFADEKPLTSNYRLQRNSKKEIQQLPPSDAESKPKQKRSLSSKQQFKFWKEIIKWKYKVSCRKRPLLLKSKKSKPPFKKRKKRSLSFLAYKQPSHRAHTTTSPLLYGGTATMVGQANSCSDSAQDSGSKSDSDDEDSDSQESNDENTSDHHSDGHSAAASSGGDDDGNNNNRDDNNRCPSGGSGGDGGGNGDDDDDDNGDDDDDGSDKDDDGNGDDEAEKDNETSSDGDDSVIPICTCDLCSDSSSVVVANLPFSVNASPHPTALNTVFTEEDLRRTFRPIMVVPSLLVVDSTAMTNYVRCGETSSMVTGTQQVMCSPSQPCHQGCRGESVVSEIIFNQNLPGENCSSTLPQDSNSSGGRQYIEQFYVEDGPLQEQESVEALQGLTYWDSWSSQI